ncbi:MAG: hypothetical protein ACJAXQ_001161 [Parvibaculaceae bacterium]|jgi:hypothetical protein
MKMGSTADSPAHACKPNLGPETRHIQRIIFFLADLQG